MGPSYDGALLVDEYNPPLRCSTADCAASTTTPKLWPAIAGHPYSSSCSAAIAGAEGQPRGGEAASISYERETTVNCDVSLFAPASWSWYEPGDAALAPAAAGGGGRASTAGATAVPARLLRGVARDGAVVQALGQRAALESRNDGCSGSSGTGSSGIGSGGGGGNGYGNTRFLSHSSPRCASAGIVGFGGGDSGSSDLLSEFSLNRTAPSRRPHTAGGAGGSSRVHVHLAGCTSNGRVGGDGVARRRLVLRPADGGVSTGSLKGDMTYCRAGDSPAPSSAGRSAADAAISTGALRDLEAARAVAGQQSAAKWAALKSLAASLLRPAAQMGGGGGGGGGAGSDGSEAANRRRTVGSDIDFSTASGARNGGAGHGDADVVSLAALEDLARCFRQARHQAVLEGEAAAAATSAANAAAAADGRRPETAPSFNGCGGGSGSSGNIAGGAALLSAAEVSTALRLRLPTAQDRDARELVALFQRRRHPGRLDWVDVVASLRVLLNPREAAAAKLCGVYAVYRRHTAAATADAAAEAALCGGGGGLGSGDDGGHGGALRAAARALLVCAAHDGDRQAVRMVWRHSFRFILEAAAGATVFGLEAATTSGGATAAGPGSPALEISPTDFAAAVRDCPAAVEAFADQMTRRLGTRHRASWMAPVLHGGSLLPPSAVAAAPAAIAASTSDGGRFPL